MWTGNPEQVFTVFNEVGCTHRHSTQGSCPAEGHSPAVQGVLHTGDTLLSMKGWFEQVLSLLSGFQLSQARVCLPPPCLCPSPFTVSLALGQAMLLLVWVCLPMVGRIGQEKEKMF